MTGSAPSPATQWSIDPVRRAARRRWGLIVACLILAPVAALVVSLLQPTKYTASASLLLQNPNFASELFGSSASTQDTDADRRATTALGLLGQRAVATQAGRQLGIPTSKVRPSVTVTATPSSDIVTVDATDTDPEVAARIANAYAQAYVELRRAADRVTLQAARKTVLTKLDAMTRAERNSSVGKSLRESADQLDLLEALQSGNAELTQQAVVPSSPSSPRVKRNIALGIVLGIVLAMVLAALAERLDRRFHDPEEARSLFDKPLLSVVPRLRTTDAARLERADLDPFAMLRLNLSYYNVDTPVQKVLVTSAMQGDGKTLVAWLLGVASASGGARAIVLDADMRNPSIAQRAGLRGQPGLSEYLSGNATLKSIIQTDVVTDDRRRTTGQVDVIPAGTVPPNPAELISSARMASLLDTLAEQYDMVVIDTPPITIVPDAIPLISQADGTIVVVRTNRTRRDWAKRLQTQLTDLDARVLGLVVNGVANQDYGYGYGYAYQGQLASVPGSTDGEGDSTPVGAAERGG